jgi:O-antigen/teichoic acid export membrane protein
VSTSAQTVGQGPGTSATAVRRAVQNAARLVVSLLGTWGIALAVRLWMPRVMGPEQFGVVNFADALTASVFVLLTFGVDTYIRKEVTLRREHADEFFGSLLLARLVLTLLLLGGLAGLMAVTNQPAPTRQTVFLFGLGQLFFVTNNSLSALLHARERVDGLVLINVGTKLLWGAQVVVALSLGAGARSVALAFTISEALRALILWGLCRREAGLRLQLRAGPAWAVAAASAPFFLSIIAHTVTTRVGASLLGFLADAPEVGYFGAAWTLAGMALMLAPLLHWVLMPFLSQAAARSREELWGKARRSLELVLSLTAPLALLLSLGADLIVPMLFGEAYLPAVGALRIMAPVVVLTYAAMVSSSCLILEGRAWTTTWVSLGTLGLNTALLVVLAPWLGRTLGSGGAGIGAAVALLVAEAIALTRLTHALRGRSFDRRSILRLGKTAAACLLVVAVDRALSGWGPVRLVIDAAVYTVVVLGTGAFPLDEVRRLGRMLLERRRAAAGEG